METIQDYKEVNTAQSRIESWKTAVHLAFDRPIVGGGFHAGVSQEVFRRYASPDARKPRAIHSIFFQALGEQGFPGLIMFLCLIAVAWRYGSYIRKRTRQDVNKRWAYDLAAMLQVSMVGFVVTGAINPLTYHDLPYALMALLVCLRLVVQEEEAVESSLVASHRRNYRTASSMPKVIAD